MQKKRGHLKACCFSKPSAVSAVASEDQADDAVFLGTLSTQGSSTWSGTIQLNGKGVLFKFDTGAEVSAVSEETYQRVHGKQLQRPTKVLYGPAYQSLKVLGQFEGQLSTGGRSHHLCHSRTEKQSTRTIPSLTALQLVQRLDTSLADVKGEFLRLFNGVGNLENCIKSN